MSDEDVLKHAEQCISECLNNDKITTPEQMQALNLASIAASLLVIARNSLFEIVERREDSSCELPEPNDTEPFKAGGFF